MDDSKSVHHTIFSRKCFFILTGGACRLGESLFMRRGSGKTSLSGIENFKFKMRQPMTSESHLDTSEIPLIGNQWSLRHYMAGFYQNLPPYRVHVDMVYVSGMPLSD